MTRTDQENYDYALENNVMTLSATSDVSSTTYIRISELGNYGLASQESIDNFITSNSDYQVEVQVALTSSSWCSVLKPS